VVEEVGGAARLDPRGAARGGVDAEERREEWGRGGDGEAAIAREREREVRGAPRRAPEVLDGREDVAWALPGARARAVRASAARVRWGCAVADVRDLSELFLIG